MKLYRYEPLRTYNRFSFIEFKVIKTTPQGAWICVDGFKKFVLLTARKRYACITKREAVESFIARKRKQLKILRDQIDYITPLLKNAEALVIKENDEAI